MKRRSFRAERDATIVGALRAGLAVEDAEALAWVQGGAVYVDGRRCRSEDVLVRAGQTVMVVTEERGVAAASSATGGAASPYALKVLFEDAHVLAVDKPAGITAQPTPSRVGDSLLDLASKYLGRPAGLVHRLDRETSGVTIFGKSRAATSALAAAFRNGTAKKKYVAIAAGDLPDRGMIELRLSADPKRLGRFRASSTANGLEAVTRYERIAHKPGASYVALYPETGRTHQLRAHLAALEAPIAGDTLYGGPRELLGIPAPRVLLHAQTLTLPHPETGAPLTIESPLPDDVRRFVAEIEK